MAWLPLPPSYYTSRLRTHAERKRGGGAFFFVAKEGGRGKAFKSQEGEREKGAGEEEENESTPFRPSFAPPAAATKRRKGMQGNRRLGFTKGFFLSLSLGITALIDGPSLVPSI